MFISWPRHGGAATEARGLESSEPFKVGQARSCGCGG